MDNNLYFKQIEMGPMQNFVYLIGSMICKVAVVDAAWEIDEILRLAAHDDMEITHAFVTHTPRSCGRPVRGGRNRRRDRASQQVQSQGRGAQSGGRVSQGAVAV